MWKTCSGIFCSNVNIENVADVTLMMTWLLFITLSKGRLCQVMRVQITCHTFTELFLTADDLNDVKMCV